MNRKAHPTSLTELEIADSTTRESSVRGSTQDGDFTECWLDVQEQSWRSGERLLIEAILLRYPMPNGPPPSEALLALICNERFLREENGRTPTMAEYQTRFPELARDILIQWEIDAELSSEVFNELGTADKPSGVKRIGRYEVLSELGRGAMGVVFLAWDPQLKRNIAIKRLRTGADSTTEEVARIRTEAEAVAQIQHPSIVQIFDVGEADALPYLAMEYCGGGTLDKRLSGKPIQPRLAAELIRKICDGVAAAHSQRIIHRDLKPKNVLLEAEGNWSPKVSDFGLAKLMDNDSTATATGSILGTPAYMAPEQAFGDNKRVGPAADIYALGAILYECLTGRPPFLGVSIADTLEQVRRREPIPARHLEPHVPFDLETITHKCMRKEPQQRYSTVAELQEDLSRFLNRQPILARRERWYESASRLARKYPLVAGLTTASVTLLLAITVVSLVFADSMVKANRRIRYSEIVAKLGQADALVGRAHSIRVSRQPGQRFDALAAIREAASIGRELNQPLAWYDSLRDEAISALVLPDAHIAQFRTEAQPLQYSDFTDDHRLVAMSFESGPISIRRLSDNHELATLPRIDKNCMLRFVDNSRLFQLGMPSGAIELWNVELESPQRLWSRPPVPNHSSGNRSPLIACDAKTTIVCDDAMTAEVLRTSDGLHLAQFSPKPYTRELAISLHPTHPYLAIHSYFEPGVELRNWQTGETFFRYLLESDEEAKFTGAAWSKDGRRLAVITRDGSAMSCFHFDPDSTELVLERTQSPAPNQGGGGPYLSFNTFGDRLLVFGWNNSSGLVDANLGLPVFASHPFFPTNAPKADPQETLAGIFTAPGETKYGMMSISPGRERTLLVPEQEKGGTPLVSDPTGRLLAFALADKVSILDVSSKRLLVTQRWPGLNIYSLFFDDRYFYIQSIEMCCRFPYQLSEDSPATLSLGLPERIHIPASTLNIAASLDGRTIANSCYDGFGTSQYAGCWAKLENEPAARKIVDRLGGTAASVSQDGKTIGFSTSSTTAVYQQNHGQLGQAISFPHAGRQVFSEDGKWMLNTYTILSTDSWKPQQHNFEGALYDLSADGTQIASYNSNTSFLSDVRSGKVYARIDGMHPQFLPDGSKIAIRVDDRHALCDMKLIRRGVLDLGIPWSGPDYADCVEPVSIEVAKFADQMASVETGADLLRAMDHQCEQRARLHPEDGHLAFSAAMVSIDGRNWEEALERLNQSCELLPDAITPRQWRAYLLAEMRRWPEAIADADWVLQRITDARFRFLRAQWYYHNQDFARSLEECSWLIANGPGFVTLAHGLRHLNHAAMGHETEAIADRAHFFKDSSDDVESLNSWAYYMVADDISLRQPVLASLCIEKLLSLQTEYSSSVRDTIGLVYYRNDEYFKALDTLSPNLSDTTNALYPCALSVIVMSAAKLNDRDSAEKHLQELEVWQPSKDLKLKSLIEIEKLRSEAKRVCKQ